MFYIEWADANQVAFWIIVVCGLLLAWSLAAAVFERGGRNKW